jgi:hypothetical protein
MAMIPQIGDGLLQGSLLGGAELPGVEGMGQLLDNLLHVTLQEGQQGGTHPGHAVGTFLPIQGGADIPHIFADVWDIEDQRVHPVSEVSRTERLLQGVFQMRIAIKQRHDGFLSARIAPVHAVYQRLHRSVFAL